MNSLGLCFALGFVAIAFAADLPPCPCHERRPNHWPEPEPCHANPEPESEPCKVPDCSIPQPEITQVAFSKLRQAEVTSDTVFICESGSKFQRVEQLSWTIPYQQTCNGIVTGTKHNVRKIYKGYKWNGESVILNAGRQDYTSYFNNGNEDYAETITLKGCRCEGDELRSMVQFVNDDLEACCTKGAGTLWGVYGELQIKGKCCSRCHLQTAKEVYTPVLKNN